MRPWSVLAVLLAATLGWAAEPEGSVSRKWAAWEHPAQAIQERGSLEIIEDEAAQSLRAVKGEDGQEKPTPSALMLRVSRRTIAKQGLDIARTPVVPWEQLPAGVYRVSARVKYNGDQNLIGTPIVLAVEPDSTDTLAGLQAQGYYSFDLADEDEYTQISFLYEVDPTHSKYLKARKTRHAWGWAGYMKDIYPEWEPPKTSAPKPSTGIRLSVSLPKTKYSVGEGLPPNSLRSVSVDWLAIEKIEPSPSLTVRHVRAVKRWLRPGEEQSFDIAVENFRAEPASAELVVQLVHGIDSRIELHRQKLELAAGQVEKLTLPWATQESTPLWGWQIEAKVVDGDEVHSQSKDVFSVHPGVYYVHVMGGNHCTLDPFRERENLANLVEVFGATSGDCAQVMPPHDQWVSGMSDVVPMSFKTTRHVTDFNRSMGVATHMYLFAGGTSQPLLDMYIRRPEWLASRPAATDEMYRIMASTRQMVAKHDFSKGRPEVPLTPHVEEALNWWFPELMEKVTRETIEFVERAGYDGIRFDVGIFGPRTVKTVLGETLPFKAEDMMAQGARNFEYYKDALREKFPHFEFGANMDTWAYLETVGRRNEAPPDPESYPEFVAFARAGGMFMDEGTMNAPDYNHYMNRFEDALWSMVQKREMARRFGGVYQLFSPHRDGRGHFAHDDIYWTIMIIASGSYYVGNFSAAPYSEDGPGEFIVRFSEFFRSMNLKPLPEAQDAIFIDSPEILWYADTAVWEDIGNTRRYVVPIINPPVNERLRRNKSNELPPPIDEPFNIEVQVPEGYRTAKAWMLTWEPRVEAVELKVEIDDNTAQLSFPGIKLFRTLVMEFEK